MSENRSASKDGRPQSERFKDAAHELGCDDDEAAFDAKLGKLARAKVEPAPKPPKKERKPSHEG